MKRLCAVVLILVFVGWPTLSVADGGQVRATTITSSKFDGNKIGLSAERRVRIYLPPGYADSARRYPVVYFLHGLFENEAAFFDDHDGQALLDGAIAEGALREVILVTADFDTPAGGSFYISSPVTGDWSGFLVDELVPYVDRNYRTLDDRNSRALVGDRTGGYGAIRFAQEYADTFGIVYALHPVATGFGNIVMQSRPNWETLERAQSIEDVREDVFSLVFTAIYQATLPDVDRPPLFFQPPARRLDGELVIDAALVEELQERFFLERQVAQYAEPLKSLRAFKLDWGRADPNQDHVFSNQFYSRKLNEFGIPHEAEEYNGGWGDRTYGTEGRVVTDVFPFLDRNLVFDSQ